MLTNQYRVVIIGAGEIGGTLGGVLKGNGVNVEFWDSNPDKVPNQKNLILTLPEADFVFLCVPSWGMRKALLDIYSHLKPEAVVISLAKGIESTHKTMDELLKELLPSGQTFALLGGPMIAEEIKQGKPGYAVIACEKGEVLEQVKELFFDTNIHLSYSGDLRGIALDGVLKNVYTLAVGLEEYYELGSNVRGWVVTQSMHEMGLIISKLGGKPETLHNLAGLGDFLATALTHYSRNREAIEELAGTGELKSRSEGTVSLEPLLYRLGGETADYPILRTIANILLDHAEPKEAFTRLLEDANA